MKTADYDDGHIFREGWLQRKGKLLWKKGYFVLKSDALHCYNNEKQELLVSSVPLSAAVAKRSMGNGFKIFTPDISYEYRGEADEDSDVWIQSITRAVSVYGLRKATSRGNGSLKVPLLKIPMSLPSSPTVGEHSARSDPQLTARGLKNLFSRVKSEGSVHPRRASFTIGDTADDRKRLTPPSIAKLAPKTTITIFFNDEETAHVLITIPEMTILQALEHAQRGLRIQIFEIKQYCLVRKNGNDEEVVPMEALCEDENKKGPLYLSPPYNAQLEATKMFGAPIDICLMRSQRFKPDNLPYMSVPYPVFQCGEFIKQHGLDSEGVLRLSGSQQKVKEKKKEFDSGEEVEFEPHQVDLASSVLKLYLLSLPDPVCTFELYTQFMDAAKLSDESSEKLEILKRLVWSLPTPNYNLLKYLCALAILISANERENKMSVLNISVVFGPNIMRCDHDLSDSELSVHSGLICNITQMLIIHFAQLFTDEREDFSDNDVIKDLHLTNPSDTGGYVVVIDDIDTPQSLDQ